VLRSIGQLPRRPPGKPTALVSCDEDTPFRPGSARRLVTLRLAGNDVADYLDIGGHFDLWLGSNVGDGIVTRRLFV
jgi:hypothetical protein